VPEGIENRRVILLENVFGYLWKKREPFSEVDLDRISVACNINVAFP
jgi:hypothetical protein